VKVAAVALLSLTLAGCASAAHAPAPRVAVASRARSLHPARDARDTGADDDLVRTAEDAVDELLTAGQADLEEQAEQAEQAELPAPAPPMQDQQAPQMLGGFEPGAVHQARIELARAELVEENLNKERVDLAEELQRELAALRASQTSKSRVRRGGATKKQP
jgi:hypothetical protein